MESYRGGYWNTQSLGLSIVAPVFGAGLAIAVAVAADGWVAFASVPVFLVAGAVPLVYRASSYVALDHVNRALIVRRLWQETILFPDDVEWVRFPRGPSWPFPAPVVVVSVDGVETRCPLLSANLMLQNPELTRVRMHLVRAGFTAMTEGDIPPHPRRGSR